MENNNMDGGKKPDGKIVARLNEMMDQIFVSSRNIVNSEYSFHSSLDRFVTAEKVSEDKDLKKSSEEDVLKEFRALPLYEKINRVVNTVRMAESRMNLVLARINSII